MSVLTLLNRPALQKWRGVHNRKMAASLYTHIWVIFSKHQLIPPKNKVFFWPSYRTRTQKVISQTTPCPGLLNSAGLFPCQGFWLYIKLKLAPGWQTGGPWIPWSVILNMCTLTRLHFSASNIGGHVSWYSGQVTEPSLWLLKYGFCPGSHIKLSR